MLNESDLREQNPWWDVPRSIVDDEAIRAWEDSAICYDPEMRRDITYDYEPSNTVIYTLYGVRQIGKTTMIKLQIRDFLDGGVRPWNLFYSFDRSSSDATLGSVVKSYLEQSRGRKAAQDRTYIFLDEVTVVPRWEKSLKGLVDAGRLKNCTVMVAGSRSDSIVGSINSILSRCGSPRDGFKWLALPMKFSDYVCATDAAVAESMSGIGLDSPSARKAAVLGLFKGEVGRGVDLLHSKFVDALDRRLYEYFLTGGIPGIVDAYIKTGSIPDHLYEQYCSGLEGDWRPRSGDLLKRIGGALDRGPGSSMSWNALRMQAAVGSWGTAQDYALFLKDMSIIGIVHRYGENKKAPMFARDKKFYFRDPFYAHLLARKTASQNNFGDAVRLLSSEAAQGRAAESVVADHLIRLSYDLAANKSMFDYYDHVFYWRSGEGKEVDFVMYQEESHEVPVEVKYRSRIAHRDLTGMCRFLGATGSPAGLVLSKSSLQDTRSYLVVPAAVFLMLV